MITKEVLEYLRAEISRGTPQDVIKNNIIKTGWTESDYAEMLAALNPKPTTPTASVDTPSVVAQPQPQPIQVTQPIQNPGFTMPTAVDPIAMKPQSNMAKEPLPVQPAVNPAPVSSIPATQTSPVSIASSAALPKTPITTMPMATPVLPNITQEVHVQAEPVVHTPQTTMMPHSFVQTQVHMDIPAVSPVTVMPSSPKRKIKTVILIVILSLLLVAGVAYGYVGGYFVSLEKVSQQAIASAQSAKTAHFDMTLTVDTSGLKQQTPDISSYIPGLGKVFSLTMKGSSDATDPQNPKATNFLTFSAGNISAAVDMRMLSGTLYAELTKAPLTGIFPLEQYENKWFSFPLKKDGNSISTFSNSVPYLPVNADILNSLSDDQKKHLYDLAKNANFIKVTKRLTPQSINGTLSYHFMFDIDHDGTKTYLKSVNDYMHEIGKNDSQLSSVDVSALGNYLDGVHTFSGEMWIGIINHLPQKISIAASVGDKDHLDAGDVKITFVALMSDWNKQVIVDAPAQSQPFMDLLINMTSGTSNNPAINQNMIPCIPGPNPKDSCPPTTTPVTTHQGDMIPCISGPGITCGAAKNTLQADDTDKQSILANMRAQGELYYTTNNNSYVGVCSSDTGLHRMAKSLPSGTDYKCRESRSAWAASVNLSTGDYFCVDTTGVMKNETTAIKTTACQ